ncbi:MAG TPA: hypothetical protein VGR07_19180, partial [Thermoanaerobaculia bacterium]|nr:hypothetical protein [Thermoanaerobaculia bacterium]
DTVLRWDLMASKLAPLVAERPHLKPVHDALVQLLADAKAHAFEAKSLRVQAQQSAIDRRALVKTGDSLRARLGAALAFEHGTTSVALTEFGVKPRRGGPGRPKKKKPLAEVPETSAAG